MPAESPVSCRGLLGSDFATGLAAVFSCSLVQAQPVTGTTVLCNTPAPFDAATTDRLGERLEVLFGHERFMDAAPLAAERRSAGAYPVTGGSRR
jgi:hypothetical protein